MNLLLRFNNHLIIHAGLLAIQNSPSLQNLSGFDELERVGMLVIAFLGNDMVDMDAFNSLRTAVTIIITRNMVCSHSKHTIMGIRFVV